MMKTVGYVQAVDGISFNIKQGETVDWSVNPAAARRQPASCCCVWKFLRKAKSCWKGKTSAASAVLSCRNIAPLCKPCFRIRGRP